jgi:hypothetical protein
LPPREIVHVTELFSLWHGNVKQFPRAHLSRANEQRGWQPEDRYPRMAKDVKVPSNRKKPPSGVCWRTGALMAELKGTYTIQ